MTEIERKFLLIDDAWRTVVDNKINIVQGYLANTDRGSIRVRLSGEKATLNIKSMTLAVSRSEFEYPIPVDEAEVMLNELCLRPLIEKVRYLINQDGHTWEIDEFGGDNKGLIIAEIELQNADEEFIKPGWLGDEVSDDPRYYNVSLVGRPYSQW